MAFKVGDWIQNKKYGVGQVEKTLGTDKYEVRFVDRPSETRALIEAGLAPGAQPHENFKFPKPARTRTPGASTSNRNRKPALDFDQLLQCFLRVFPNGFDGEAFDVRERQYKAETAALLRDRLSRERLSDLIGKGDWLGIAESAKQVVRDANLVFTHEKIKFVEGVSKPENQQNFARALFDLLYGSGEAEHRFVRFIDILSVMGCNKWTLATYFQFLATDGAVMFMKPAVMQPMADSVGVALNYQSMPNWLTYLKLQELGDVVAKRLRDRGQHPQNGMDVQGFIWSSIRIDEGKYEKSNAASA